MIFNLSADIIEGGSLGGIQLDMDIFVLRDWLRSPSNFQNISKIEGKTNLNILFRINASCVQVEVDFLSQTICELRALNGYKGKWRHLFQPGNFNLIDLLRFDWTFEHMSRGLIMSEHYKGIAFAVPEQFEDDFHFLERVSTTYEMAQAENFLIGEIVIFPEFIGNKRLWDVYEPYIWEQQLKEFRTENKQFL